MSEDSRHQSCTQPATVLDPPMFGEIERVIRRRGERMGAKHGGQFYLAAADAIRDLRVALASQIEISNDLRGQLESRHQVGDESELRKAAERMVQTYRDWLAGCDNDTRAKDVEAAHIHLRDTLAKLHVAGTKCTSRCDACGGIGTHRDDCPQWVHAICTQREGER